MLDTTYIGRNWAVLVTMDAKSGQTLYKKYVKRERTKADLNYVQISQNQGLVNEQYGKALRNSFD